MAFPKFSFLCLVVVLSVVVFEIHCNEVRHERAYSEEEEEGENQFIFKREKWERIDAEAGHVRVAPSFRENARSAPQVHNFEVNCVEMEPNSLMLPHYITASWYMYVYEGKGRIGWVRNQKLIEQDVEAGQVYYVPEGSPFYVINTDRNQRLHVINLMHNKNPGPDRHHELYYVGGGQDPPTVYAGFRRQTLAAGFGTGIREVEKVLSKQDRGPIVFLSKEQRNDEFLSWPWSSKKYEGSEEEEEEKPFNLLKKETVFTNDHGQYIKADRDSFPPLGRLDLAMGLTTINEGSMVALHWSSRTTAVSMILEGRGRVEIVTPGRGGSKRRVESYERVEGELTAGDLIVVPAGHPNAEISYSGQQLVILTFHIDNEHNEFYYLTGKHSVVSLIQGEVLAISMNEKQRALQKVIDAQKDEMFLTGPKDEDKGWSIVSE